MQSDCKSEQAGIHSGCQRMPASQPKLHKLKNKPAYFVKTTLKHIPPFPTETMLSLLLGKYKIVSAVSHLTQIIKFYFRPS